MASRTQNLIIYGYLREILSDQRDYCLIIGIIIEYIKQGIARYYNEKFNKDFMKEMQFGDIAGTSNKDMMVLNEENKLENVGWYEFENTEDYIFWRSS